MYFCRLSEVCVVPGGNALGAARRCWNRTATVASGLLA
jgi:hypothetical protein